MVVTGDGYVVPLIKCLGLGRESLICVLLFIVGTHLHGGVDAVVLFLVE